VGIRFRVTLRIGQVQAAALDDIDQAIVAMVCAPEGPRPARSPTGSSSRRVPPAPASPRWWPLGLVREIGTGRQDPRRRYFSAGAP
jgi:hypothetical protein